MKPIATLMKPLRSVDLAEMTEAPAAIERSDVCAISAAAVVGEAVVSLRAGRRLSRKIQRRLPRRNRSELQSRQRATAVPLPNTTVVIRPILKFGEAPLHGPAAEVGELTDDIQKLIDDMIETMYAAPGIGLAAPQVGVPLRIFVVDLSLGHNADELMVFINPAFVEREGMQLEEEGCLSVPGFNATVARPLRAVIKGLDRNGDERIVEGKDLLARAFQHEMDHLDGPAVSRSVRGIKRDLIVKKIRKLTRAGKW